MDINVYNTYATDKNGKMVMHFDVFMEKKDNKLALKYAKEFVESTGKKGLTVKADECSFCHVQGATANESAEIKKKGYFIYKMEGC